MKNQKPSTAVRSLLLTGGACLSTACVSGPQVHLPKPLDCPPEAIANLKRYDIDSIETADLSIRQPPKYVPIKENTIYTAEFIRPFGTLPEGTLISGQFYVGEERVYGRFNQLHLQGGPTIPVCFEVRWNRDLGTPLLPESKPGKPVIYSSMHLWAVHRFK